MLGPQQFLGPLIASAGEICRRTLGTPVAFSSKVIDVVSQNCIEATSSRRSGTMSVSKEIFAKVASVLEEALNVNEDEITPQATLLGDLGAESIDMLDIVFRLERVFAIRIPRGELFPESVFHGDPAFVQEGQVTDAGMLELRSRMPYANLDGFERNRRLSAVSDLFTVDLVARYVAWKLSQGTGASSATNASVPQASHDLASLLGSDQVK
jgi:acyl carrier protein